MVDLKWEPLSTAFYLAVIDRYSKSNAVESQ